MQQDVYTARQAIFNKQQNVVAYELFFRDGPENVFPDVDAHDATSKLIVRTHLNDGIKPFTSNKQALINFSEESLLNGLPYILNPQEIVIEILETVRPTDEVYSACLELYRAGYKLALDDFVYEAKWKRFLSLVKLVKFDILVTPLDSIEPLIKKLKHKKALLAEKVETKEEFIKAKKMGFRFFQGYFFCKPEMKKCRDVESNHHNLLLLQREGLRCELNYPTIASLFERDSSLAYKLLRYINGGTFQLNIPISSIKQALVYIGELQVRRMISLVVTSVLASDKAPELTKMCIIRARFCELVVKKAAPGLVEPAFLCGMFSLLDAILDKPLENIIDNLPLSQEIVEALTDALCQTPIAIALRTIKLLERNKWHDTEKEASKLCLNYKDVSNFYRSAIIWSDFQDEIRR